MRLTGPSLIVRREIGGADTRLGGVRVVIGKMESLFH